MRTTPGHSKMGVHIHTYTNRNWLTYIFTSSYRAAFLDTDERLILKHQIWLILSTTNTYNNNILSTTNTYNNNIKWNDLTLHLWCSKSRTQMTQFVRILPGRSKLGIHPPRETPTHRPVPDFVQYSLGNATKYKDPRVLWVSPVYSGNPSSFHKAYHSFNYVPKI